MSKIEVKLIDEHYEIFVNGKFEISCDENELNETIKEIEDEYDV